MTLMDIVKNLFNAVKHKQLPTFYKLRTLTANRLQFTQPNNPLSVKRNGLLHK
jgi:hypothetical protein